MSVKRIIYLILAILGLVLPWYYNLQFFSNAGLLDFINESSANLAAKSVSLDLFIATLAGSIWMYVGVETIGYKFCRAVRTSGCACFVFMCFPRFSCLCGKPSWKNQVKSQVEKLFNLFVPPSTIIRCRRSRYYIISGKITVIGL
jgi:hypothetical protein